MALQYLKKVVTPIYILNPAAKSMLHNALENVNRVTTFLFLHNFSEL